MADRVQAAMAARCSSVEERAIPVALPAPGLHGERVESYSSPPPANLPCDWASLSALALSAAAPGP